MTVYDRATVPLTRVYDDASARPVVRVLDVQLVTYSFLQ